MTSTYKTVEGRLLWRFAGEEKYRNPIPLCVLGYVDEDGAWCALCLQMDLRGYGATFDEARSELESAIMAQFRFAIEERRNPSLIFFDAEDKYFEIYRSERGCLLFHEYKLPEIPRQEQVSLELSLA